MTYCPIFHNLYFSVVAGLGVVGFVVASTAIAFYLFITVADAHDKYDFILYTQLRTPKL